jgi:hypothetical protein
MISSTAETQNEGPNNESFSGVNDRGLTAATGGVGTTFSHSVMLSVGTLCCHNLK